MKQLVLQTIIGTLLCINIAYAEQPKVWPENIEKSLQAKVASLLENSKKKLHAQKILTIIMDTHTGQILSMVSSKSDALASEIAVSLYEPGSVMKPVTLAIALDGYGVQADEQFPMYEGKLKLDKRYTIRDDTNSTTALTPAEIIIQSSNIGISQIAWRIPGEVFWERLNDLGFGQKSGIGLPEDSKGWIRNEAYYQTKLHRANTSYGYGLTLTPLHLLRVYAAFANGGQAPRPNLDTPTGNTETLFSPEVAQTIKGILNRVVIESTGQAAQRSGLYIGGKTGTAHRVSGGKYVDRYDSSFYGFVEDDAGHSYTIGVVVLNLNKKHPYFSSQTATPLFGKIVDEMVAQGYVTPTKNSTKPIYPTPLKNATISRPYGLLTDPVYKFKIFNESITLKPSEAHSPVQSIADGVVIFAGEREVLKRVVVIQHDNGLYSAYSRLSQITPQIRKGIKVKQGETLGRVSEKLVFMLSRNKHSVDPLSLVKF